MANEVFISYSRSDFEKVSAIKKMIEEETGIDCWMDLEGIESDEDNFKRVIIKAIKQHNTLLFMMSTSSMGSKYALKELGFAEEEKKRTILVSIDQAPMTDDFKFDYKAKQIIDWSNSLQRNKLLSDLKKWFPNEVLLKRQREERLRKEREQERIQWEAEQQRKKEEEERKKREQREAQRKRQQELAGKTAGEAKNVNTKERKKKIDEVFLSKYKAQIGTFVGILILGIFFFKGCDGKSSKGISLLSEIDTASYAIGMAQTEGLYEYLSGTMNIDTTQMESFLLGFQGGSMPSNDDQKKAYISGGSIRMQMDNKTIPGINNEIFGDDSTKTISSRLFYAGFTDAIRYDYHIMDVETAHQTAVRLMNKIKDDEMEKMYGDNKKKGEEYLKINANKEGVISLPEGTQYRIIREGHGAIPRDTSLVTVHYEGRTIDGNVFDSSYKRNESCKFRCNQVIKGWTDVLTRMPVGSEWEVYIPQERAYGNRKQGSIDPYSVLIFKVELLKVEQ